MFSSSTGDARTAMKFMLFPLTLTSIDATSTTVATTSTGDASTGLYKYYGAAAIGTKVFFAPSNQHNVGIYDAATSAFSTAATTGAASTGYNKYSGAAAIGTKVFFAPFSQNNVGIYDNTTAAPTAAPTTVSPTAASSNGLTPTGLPRAKPWSFRSPEQSQSSRPSSWCANGNVWLRLLCAAFCPTCDAPAP